MNEFFLLIFPWANIFWYSAYPPPPLNEFSNRSSLTTLDLHYFL